MSLLVILSPVTMSVQGATTVLAVPVSTGNHVQKEHTATSENSLRCSSVPIVMAASIATRKQPRMSPVYAQLDTIVNLA
jgi:hypothetical protein